MDKVELVARVMCRQALEAMYAGVKGTPDLTSMVERDWREWMDRARKAIVIAEQTPPA